MGDRVEGMEADMDVDVLAALGVVQRAGGQGSAAQGSKKVSLGEKEPPD